MLEKIISQGVTFDDVLLVPRHSEIVPSDGTVTVTLTSSSPVKTAVCSADSSGFMNIKKQAFRAGAAGLPTPLASVVDAVTVR